MPKRGSICRSHVLARRADSASGLIDLNPQAAKILRDLTPDSADRPYFRNTLGQQRSPVAPQADVQGR
jgi:hypothetical protein